MFHRVIPGKQKSVFNNILEVTPEYLEYCINYFKKNDYAIVSLDVIHQVLDNRECLGRKFVAFTFDDGYADIFHHAYPILKKYNLPFALYITTSFPDGEPIPWWYLIEEAVLTNDHLAFETTDKVLNLKCSSRNEKMKTFERLRDILIDHNAPRHLLEQLYALSKNAFYRTPGELLLTWGQIEHLSRDGNVTIASHTLRHSALNRLSTAGAREEILKSKEILEARTDREVCHFAYPFGGRTEARRREFDIVRELGFRTGTTARCGNIFYDHGRHLECLPRVMAREGLSMGLCASGVLPFLKNKFRSFVAD